MEHILIRVRK